MVVFFSYNAMDMATQTWPNGRFQSSRCTGFPGFNSACEHTAGDWFSIDCDDPGNCPPEKTHYTMLQARSLPPAAAAAVMLSGLSVCGGPPLLLSCYLVCLSVAAGRPVGCSGDLPPSPDDIRK